MICCPPSPLLQVILTVVCDSLHNTHQGSGLNIELHTSRQVDLQVSVTASHCFRLNLPTGKYMKNNSTTLQPIAAHDFYHLPF